MSFPIDPSECPWTPEGEEVYEQRRAYVEMLLNLEAEDEDYELVQYPQRFSH
jgi:hypothetical protein